MSQHHKNHLKFIRIIFPGWNQNSEASQAVHQTASCQTRHQWCHRRIQSGQTRPGKIRIPIFRCILIIIEIAQNMRYKMSWITFFYRKKHSSSFSRNWSLKFFWSRISFHRRRRSNFSPESDTMKKRTLGSSVRLLYNLIWSSQSRQLLHYAYF